MVMQLDDWEALTLGHHTVNFGGFRHYGRVDKMFLICHVISNEHLLGLSNFIGVSPL